MTKILIEIEGGCLQNVYSDDPDTEVRTVDWDEIKDLGNPEYLEDRRDLLTGLPDQIGDGVNVDTDDLKIDLGQFPHNVW